MNARILRKWSIHTKNLMSCSACSLVVVVLLLLLLLVTCAPTLVLATMNSPPYAPPHASPSSPQTSLTPPPPPLPPSHRNVDLIAAAKSLVVDPIHIQQHTQYNIQQLQSQLQYPHYMPKNLEDAKEATASAATTSLASTALLGTAAAAAAATEEVAASRLSSASTSSSSSSMFLSSSLPYKSHHRLAASPRRMEAAKSVVVSFPGYYTNRKIDDIQLTAVSAPSALRATPPTPLSPIYPAPQQIPLHTAARHHTTESRVESESRNSGNVATNIDVIDTRWIFHEDKEGHKDIVAVRGPWRARSYSSIPSSLSSSASTTPKDIMSTTLQQRFKENSNSAGDGDDKTSPMLMTSLLSPPPQERLSDSTDSNMRLRHKEGRRQLNQYPPLMQTASSMFPLPLHHNAMRQRAERQYHITPSPSPPPPPPASLKNQNQPQVVALTRQLPAIGDEDDDDDDDDENKDELAEHIDDKYSKKLLSSRDNKSKKEFLLLDNTYVNKMKQSAALASSYKALVPRYVIESYEVPISQNSRTPQLKQLPQQQQQQRLLLHQHHHQRHEKQQQQLKQLRTMQQQAARRRRDSLRGNGGGGAGGGSFAYNKRDRYQSNHDQQSQQYQQQQQTNFRKLHNHNHHNHNHNHNHNNHHRNHNYNQGHMRRHARRYCSARDPAQLAFEAPTVFEGKIVSMTPDRRMNFSATVEVREIFKQQIGFRLQKYLRLQFAYRNTSGECDIYREQLRPRGLVKGDAIEPGRMYLLFVQQIDIGNFTILGQPIRKTKRVVEAVRNAVSENYAQLASIKSISASNRTVENGQELRIVCKVSGRPPPKVTWFKDHRSINRNRKLYQFTHYKKRSELIIRSFNTSDAGRYECRAKNKVNRNIERRAIVIKAYPVAQRFDPNPRGAGNNCPDDASEFCFNGGTCKFFSEISSYSCICPEGFIGERCDRKEVNNPSTYSNEQECGHKSYFGGYYC